MKKIPKIFKPNIERQINNNRNVYYSFIEEKVDNYRLNEKKEDVIDTLNRLIKENAYVFNKRVLIQNNFKTFDTKIAGKIGNDVVTIDGDSININDIVEIIEK